MRESMILTAENGIADGGGTLSLALPAPCEIQHIAVFPVTVSIPNTSVAVHVYIGDDHLTQLMPVQQASSDATYPDAAISDSHVLLYDDRQLTLKAIIYNLTSATVIWRMVCIAEVFHNE